MIHFFGVSIVILFPRFDNVYKHVQKIVAGFRVNPISLVQRINKPCYSINRIRQDQFAGLTCTAYASQRLMASIQYLIQMFNEGYTGPANNKISFSKTCEASSFFYSCDIQLTSIREINFRCRRDM